MSVVPLLLVWHMFESWLLQWLTFSQKKFQWVFGEKYPSEMCRFHGLIVEILATNHTFEPSFYLCSLFCHGKHDELVTVDLSVHNMNEFDDVEIGQQNMTRKAKPIVNCKQVTNFHFK